MPSRPTVSLPLAMKSEKTIALFFCAWIGCFLILSNIPLPSSIQVVEYQLVSLVFTGIYLLLASSLTYTLFCQLMLESRKYLYLCSALSLVLFCLHYVYVATTENTPNVLSAISTANLLFFANVLGVGLSTAIKRIGELVPVSITAAMADMVSVYRGPTEEMVDDIAVYYQEGMVGTPPFVDFIVIKAGMPGMGFAVPLFGVTDWILIVLFSATLARLRIQDNLVAGGKTVIGVTPYLPITVVALYAGLVIAALTQSFIPAMPFIVIFFLAFLCIKERLYRYIEKTDIAYSIIFPLFVFLVIYLASK